MILGLTLTAALILPGGGSLAGRQAALTQHVPAVVASGAAQRMGPAPARQTMELSIELPSRNEAELQSLLKTIYDPKSPFFRHYLSVSQFTERFGPTAGDYSAIVRFARAHNLHPHALAANRRLLDVQGSVADVERAFNVGIGVYRDPAKLRSFYAPDREPTLDAGVRVLHVSGLDDYDVPVSHRMQGSEGDLLAKKRTGSGPDGNFIGSDVRAAYFGSGDLDGSGQSLGLFEYAGYNLADVALYFKTVNEPDNVPVNGVSLNGANLNCTGNCDDAEQVLDIEEAISMAPALTQVVVYVGHSDISIINQMAVDNTSKQLSCSWGWTPDPKQLDPILEELAMQGQTFLVATGDEGYHLKKGGVWPSDDQNVTAVGGTDLKTDGPGGAWKSEKGWRFSGGGPSPDKIAIPSYQVPFINAQNAGSTKLRNVPDIAGDGDTDNFSCFDGKCYTYSGGTSYAAPLWAGFIALANQYGAAGNDAPLGFLNPVLYTIGAAPNYAQVFHDQTVGFNGLYNAVPNFDLVTGFGSPNSLQMIQALEAGS